MPQLVKKSLLLLFCLLALPSLASARPPIPPGPVEPGSPVSAIERRALTADVAEYFFKVRVGSGPYDEIGVHRVVKEKAPNVPARAAKAVFLAPGDVWGIDYRWTFVPASVTDLSLMQSWGIEQDARDLGVAIGVARITRALTGSGAGKIFLLGWSRGGQIGYVYLNGETQLPPGLRQVRGFVPVDI